jgi:hypothetical protein
MQNQYLLRIIRIINVAFLISVLFVLSTLIILSVTGFHHIFSADDISFIPTQVILIIFSSAFFTLAFLWPWVSRWPQKNIEITNILYSQLFIRLPLCFSISIFSLILYLLGSDWFVVIPLLVLSAVGLILNYPTKTYINKWIKEN